MNRVVTARRGRQGNVWHDPITQRKVRRRDDRGCVLVHRKLDLEGSLHSLHQQAVSRPLLLIPMEIKARELPSKLYLAANAIQRGYSVLLGEASGFHHWPHRYPRGIVIENDIAKLSRSYIRHARALGSR